MRGSTFEPMSFDFTIRYRVLNALAEALRLPSRPLRILDVGAPTGMQGRPDDLIVSVGPRAQQSAESVRAVIASGTQLPFADCSVDLVICADTMEHLPDSSRPLLLEELLRVTKRNAALVGPFDDPATQAADELVAWMFKKATGQPHPHLTEHQLHGLPNLANTKAWLRNRGVESLDFRVLDLRRWLLVQTAQIAALRLDEGARLVAALDVLEAELQPATQGPAYSRLLIMGRPNSPLDPRLVQAAAAFAETTPGGGQADWSTALNLVRDVANREFGRLKEGENEELRELLDQSRTALAEANARLLQYRQALATATDDLEGHRAALRNATDDLEAHRVALATIQQDLNGHRATLATVQQDLAGHRAALAEANDLLDRHRQTVKLMSQKLSNMTLRSLLVRNVHRIFRPATSDENGTPI